MGPAVFIEVSRFIAARRRVAQVSDEDVLFDTFYAFLLPQFEGVDDIKGQELFDFMKGLVGSDKRERLAETLKEVLGVEPETGTSQPAPGFDAGVEEEDRGQPPLDA